MLLHAAVAGAGKVTARATRGSDATVLLLSDPMASTGMYKGAAFKFTFVIEQDYPHKPPKVKCVPKVRALAFRPLQLACWPGLTVTRPRPPDLPPQR